MKKRKPLSPAAKLLEDENSPNVTKRKLAIAIAKELSDEAATRAATAQKAGQIVESERVPTQLAVQAIIQKTLDHITKAMSANKTIELRNFGVFEVRISKARIGRNPRKPEADVPIPARAVVKFTPGKVMRELVLKLTPRPAKASAARKK